jgi:hypothetical protein
MALHRVIIFVTARENFRHCERSAAVHHRAPPRWMAALRSPRRSSGLPRSDGAVPPLFQLSIMLNLRR